MYVKKSKSEVDPSRLISALRDEIANLRFSRKPFKGYYIAFETGNINIECFRNHYNMQRNEPYSQTDKNIKKILDNAYSGEGPFYESNHVEHRKRRTFRKEYFWRRKEINNKFL